ncbi:hypothetical protein QWI30_03210 [Citrobacter freundii]|nr:hypothetical protein [Citrobacter freundii]
MGRLAKWTMGEMRAISNNPSCCMRSASGKHKGVSFANWQKQNRVTCAGSLPTATTNVLFTADTGIEQGPNDGYSVLILGDSGAGWNPAICATSIRTM